MQDGDAVLDAVFGTADVDPVDAIADVSPKSVTRQSPLGFGEIYSRSTLEPRDRRLITRGLLTARGGCEPQLEVHINAAVIVGLTPAGCVNRSGTQRGV